MLMTTFVHEKQLKTAFHLISLMNEAAHELLFTHEKNIALKLYRAFQSFTKNSFFKKL